MTLRILSSVCMLLLSWLDAHEWVSLGFVAYLWIHIIYQTTDTQSEWDTSSAFVIWACWRMAWLGKTEPLLPLVSAEEWLHPCIPAALMACFVVGCVLRYFPWQYLDTEKHSLYVWRLKLYLVLWLGVIGVAIFHSTSLGAHSRVFATLLYLCVLYPTSPPPHTLSDAWIARGRCFSTWILLTSSFPCLRLGALLLVIEHVFQWVRVVSWKDECIQWVCPAKKKSITIHTPQVLPTNTPLIYVSEDPMFSEA